MKFGVSVSADLPKSI